MRFGAGLVAAKKAGAAAIVDPSPYAVGSIRDTYAKYPNAVGILPAMGYGDAQIAELAETIRRTPCDVVVVGTPIDLTRVVDDRQARRARALRPARADAGSARGGGSQGARLGPGGQKGRS